MTRIKSIYNNVSNNRLLAVSLLISIITFILNHKDITEYWLSLYRCNPINSVIVLIPIVMLLLTLYFILKIKGWIQNNLSKANYLIENNIPSKIILTIVILFILLLMFDDKQYKTISFFVFLIITSMISILSFVLSDYLTIKAEMKSTFRRHILLKRNKAHTYLLIWRSCLIIFLLIEIITMTKHYEYILYLSKNNLVISIPTLICSLILSITLFLGAYRAKQNFIFLNDLHTYVKLITYKEFKDTGIDKLLHIKIENEIDIPNKKYLNKKNIEYILKILANKKD